MSLTWISSQAQTVDSVDSKVGLQTIYMPQFNVQEASDNNIQAYGVRWMLSDYDSYPLEFGFHAYSGFGDVSRISLGLTWPICLPNCKVMISNTAWD